MKWKRMLVITLVLLKNASACIACAQTSSNITNSVSGDTQATTTATEVTETMRETLDIPDLTDYNGATFTTDVVDMRNSVIQAIYNPLSLTEETGDTTNDLVFRAVRNVSERLNINFEHHYSKDVWATTLLRTNALAGDGSIDAFSYIDRFGTKYASDDLIVSYKDIPGINFDKPWWYGEINYAITIGGNLCFAMGAMNMDTVSNMQLLLYNKNILADYGLDDLYTLVREGKWTIDTMYTMMANVTTDLNGDGVMTSADLWGACYTHDVWYNDFGPLSNVNIIEKDENDLPYLSVIGNDKLISIWQKLLNYLNQGNGFVVSYQGDTGIYNLGNNLYEEVIYMFKDGKSLFSSASGLGTVAMLRDMANDFGILPFPKDDEVTAGTIYGSYINGIGMPYFVPVSNSDLERTGYVFETMCYEYYYNVIPDYIDKVAFVKQVRDEDSAEMLNMMYTNKVVDIASGYWWDECYSQMYAIFRSGKDNFISTYTADETKINKALQKTIDAFNSYNN